VAGDDILWDFFIGELLDVRSANHAADDALDGRHWVVLGILQLGGGEGGGRREGKWSVREKSEQWLVMDSFDRGKRERERVCV
jgi:hypothetical protein